MLKKLLVLALAAMIGAWALGGCDDDGSDGDGDGDADGDGDGDGDADGDSDGDADGDSDGDGDGDWPCAQASTDAPQMRGTALKIEEPPSLAIGVLQSVFDGAIDEFAFLWIMEVDFTGGTMDTGSGSTTGDVTELEGFCNVTWNDDYPPVNDIPITVTGDTISTTGPVAALQIPIYQGGELLLELPMTNVELNDLVFSADRTIVGTPVPGSDPFAFAADWETAGSLSGWLGWDDARMVPIEDLSTDLCALLCGATCTENPADTTCRSGQEPTEMPGGGMGYRLVASLGAGAVTITE